SIAKTIFERSAPLSIPVTIFGDESPLSDFIFTLAPRWKSLHFYSDVQITTLVGIPTLQSLESLRLTSDLEIYPLTIECFLGAPHLRDVSLNVWRASSFPMPWSQLTSLSLSSQTEPAQILLDILVQCTNIEDASLLMIPWTQMPAPTSDKISQLSRLKTLKLEIDNSPIAAFFAHLALPALSQLFIETCSDCIWSSAGFSAFQRRSPSIRELMLMGPLNIPSEGFVSLIHESPCLEELFLDRCFAGPNAVDAALFSLQYSDTHTVHHAPRLQRLSIIDSEGRFDETMLERTICSRWWTDSQLRALPAPPPVARWAWFRIAKEFHEDAQDFSDSFREKIVQLREEGLDVSIDEFD
ncbi:hypothetical protein FB45DRAFT_898321, partial [Roridomyces roridus]